MNDYFGGLGYFLVGVALICVVLFTIAFVRVLS